MSDYHVSCGPFSGNIYAGRVNKAGTAFTSKSDVTEHALLAVAELVLDKHDGSVELTAPGEQGYRITVEVLSGGSEQ